MIRVRNWITNFWNGDGTVTLRANIKRSTVNTREKKSVSALFLNFSRNFPDFSRIFARFFLPILEGSNRYFSRKKILILIFFGKFIVNFHEVSWNFREQNIYFYGKLRGIFSAELCRINSRAFMLEYINISLDQYQAIMINITHNSYLKNAFKILRYTIGMAPLLTF